MKENDSILKTGDRMIPNKNYEAINKILQQCKQDKKDTEDTKGRNSNMKLKSTLNLAGTKIPGTNLPTRETSGI